MKTKIIGTAKFDMSLLPAYCEWWRSRTFAWGKEYCTKVGNVIYALDKDIGNRVYNSVNATSSWTSSSESLYKKAIEQELSDFSAMLNYAETYTRPINVSFLSELGGYVFLDNPARGFFVPDYTTWMTVTLLKDFNNVTLGEVKSLCGSKSLEVLPVVLQETSTVTGIQSDIEDKKEDIERVNAEISEVKEAKTGELSKLQAEIDALKETLEKKKEVLLADLNKRKAEMNEKVEQMGKQIYLLESQIYAIRCYMGETVQFTQIKKGQKASDSEPIVLHQKLRFLDEELGRITALYELSWDNRDLFEDFLANSPIAQDVFTPNARCVSMVRLSRTNTQYRASEKYVNMLEKYDYYHGASTAILIRNGDNIYVGWTDEDKISIEDDMILTLKTTNVEAVEPAGYESSWAESKRIETEKKQTEQLVSAIFSRVFVFNILQGIVDSTDILPLPDGVKISQTSEYVLFALANNWLKDTRFGSFSDIVSRCNEATVEGDILLTTQNLYPSEGIWGKPRYNDVYMNERGRGYRNRTRDCNTKDCTLYPANLIEFDKPVKMIRFQRDTSDSISCTKARNKDMLIDCTILEEYEIVDKHIFVSVEKNCSPSGAHSNFEVYPREFINLTYLNTSWLNYVISSQSLGSWSVGGKVVSYAFAIRYLNLALEVVRAREKIEKELIDAVDSSVSAGDVDWCVKLSEWKMNKGVHNITAYQAKRFVKDYKLNKNITAPQKQTDADMTEEHVLI